MHTTSKKALIMLTSTALMSTNVFISMGHATAKEERKKSNRNQGLIVINTAVKFLEINAIGRHSLLS